MALQIPFFQMNAVYFIPCLMLNQATYIASSWKFHAEFIFAYVVAMQIPPTLFDLGRLKRMLQPHLSFLSISESYTIHPPIPPRQ